MSNAKEVALLRAQAQAQADSFCRSISTLESVIQAHVANALLAFGADITGCARQLGVSPQKLGVYRRLLAAQPAGQKPAGPAEKGRPLFGPGLSQAPPEDGR
jgi:hypothetical protein